MEPCCCVRNYPNHRAFIWGKHLELPKQILLDTIWDIIQLVQTSRHLPKPLQKQIYFVDHGPYCMQKHCWRKQTANCELSCSYFKLNSNVLVDWSCTINCTTTFCTTFSRTVPSPRYTWCCHIAFSFMLEL